MKHYAKKREPVRAAQWTGEISTELRDLLGGRVIDVNPQRQLILLNRGPGRVASVGDWICSSSGEDLSVVGDVDFRRSYEEADETGRALPPTSDEHEAAALEFVRALDALLIDGLKLSREGHPNIFHERESLMRTLRHLFEDQRYIAARSERQRIKDKIVKELIL
jgi:hypothetical protein